MKKSLFRISDVIELCTAYMFCFFLNLLFNYVKIMDLDSYILKAFLKNFTDYQEIIVLIFTVVVIVFHYQMLHRKKAEIFFSAALMDLDALAFEMPSALAMAVTFIFWA